MELLQCNYVFIENQRSRTTRNRAFILGMRPYRIVGDAGDIKIQKGELEDKQNSPTSFPEALTQDSGQAGLSAPSRWTSWKLKKNLERHVCPASRVGHARGAVQRVCEEFSFCRGQLNTYGIDLPIGNNGKFCIKYKTRREGQTHEQDHFPEDSK